MEIYGVRSQSRSKTEPPDLKKCKVMRRYILSVEYIGEDNAMLVSPKPIDRE